MHILCPHCQGPIELAKIPALGEVRCESCGSTFRIESEATATWGSGGGRVFGRFELIAAVGSGAFGTVYRARDPQLDRIVALKLPRAGNLPQGPEFDRFLREARSAAQLRHPAIVPIYEVGQADGVPYIVGEFVEGVTLADRLTAGRPLHSESASIVAAVAEALDAAHRVGVVHRDVKPSNIMIRPDGTPVLMDFGLARREAGEITMTLEGDVLGTPAYMSPEQAGGDAHRVDGRSDVYSLGVALYQLLTGELPFRGNSRMLLHQVLHDEPRPPRKLNDRIPRDLETICLRSMAKEPARRYPSARAMAEDLRRFIRGEPIAARPVSAPERAARWARRRPAVAALGAALALAVLGLLASLAEGNRRSAARQRLTDQALADRTRALRERTDALDALKGALAAERGLSYTLQIANAARAWEGNDVAAVREVLAGCPADLRGWEWDYLHRLTRPRGLPWFAGHTRLLPFLDEMGTASVAFAPGGEMLASACAVDGQLRSWDPRTGRLLWAVPLHVETALDAVRGSGISIDGGAMGALAISRDGRRLATASTSGDIRLRDASDGRVLRVLSGHTERVLGLDFSPDGTRLTSASVDGTARIWEVETGRQVREFRDHGEQVFGVAFHPDGLQVASCSQALDAPNILVWDSDSGAVLREFRHGSGQVCSVAFDREGRRLVSTGGQVAVWEMQTGAMVASYGGHRSRPVRAIFSEDGSRIISTDAAEIKAWDPETGRGLFDLRGQGGRISGLALSARAPTGGARLATASSDGSLRLWDPTRPVEYQILRAGPMFQSLMTNAKEFRALKRDDPVKTVDRLERMGVGGYKALAFSPLGRQLFAAWESMQGASLHVWDLETMTPLRRQELPQCSLLVFRPDGRLLATDDGGKVALRDPETGRVVRTLLTGFRDISALAFSADGKRIAGTGTAVGVSDMHAGQELNEVRVWEVGTGLESRALRGFDFTLGALAFGRAGRQLFGLGGEAVYAWDLATGRTTRRSAVTGEALPLPEPHGAGAAVEIVPGGKPAPARPQPIAPGLHLIRDGRLFLTSYGVFETETGRRLLDVGGDGFSPDGPRLVSLTTAGLRIKEAGTGRELLTLNKPAAQFQVGPVFSPDGHLLALLHPDGEILVWDATP